ARALLMRVALILCVASCTGLTLDDSAPFASLRGSPPSTAGRQHLQGFRAGDPYFVRGVDGVPWLLQSPPFFAGGPTGFPKLIRLADPPDELILSLPVRLGQGALFDFKYDIVDQKVTASHVTMTQPGAPSVQFDFDGYLAEVLDSHDETALFF